MINLIKVKVVGKNPNYFLKKMIEEKVAIYSLEKEKQALIVVVCYKDYKKICKIKTSYQIQVLERYGLSKIIFLFTRYWYFVFFLVVGFLLVFLSSQLIWDIEIIHPNPKLVDIIRKDLEELGIQTYHFKLSYLERERIKEKILEKEKDSLEWIEIEEVGTKIKVSLEERKKNPILEECFPRNIVSKKKAILLEIEAEAGEVVKKKGDYVDVGEIIISGLIHNKDRIVSKKCAKGRVYGEVWYLLKVVLPREETKEKMTSDTRWLFQIRFFQKEWIFGKKYHSFQKREYNIIDSEFLPFQVGFIHIQKKTSYSISIPFSKMEEMALTLSEEKIRDSLEKGEEILFKKVLKKSEKDSKIEIEVFLKVKEDITNYVDVSNIELEER